MDYRDYWFDAQFPDWFKKKTSKLDPKLVDQCRDCISRVGGFRFGDGLLTIAKVEGGKWLEAYTAIAERLQADHSQGSCGNAEEFIRIAPRLVKNGLGSWLEKYEDGLERTGRNLSDYNLHVFDVILIDEGKYFEDYTRLTKELREFQEYTEVRDGQKWTVSRASYSIAGEFAQRAPKVIEVAGTAGLEAYARLTKDMVEPNGTPRKKFNSHWNQCLNRLPKDRKNNIPALIEAIECFLPDDPATLYLLLDSVTPQTLNSPTVTKDLLLLDCIKDQKSAHTIGKLIDKSRYGKEYAQKCGRFY